jgi:peptidoglycan-associated lipoprotein
VYFDFDNYTVKPEYIRTLDKHGKYLAGAPGLAIKIEGHTDERGGSEYNLALGQRRAESVLRALKIYGVKDSQMEAISWGKTRPRAAGHDEASLAENRRADLVYPVK